MFFSKLIEVIKKWLKPAKVTCRVHYIIDADVLDYIKERCAKEEIPVSEILLNAIKKGYKLDISLKPEILEIFKKEGITTVILV